MSKPITQIQRAIDGTSWNLYVDGVPTLLNETFAVCAAVEAALLYLHEQSEAAEVAHSIARCGTELHPDSVY